jgi:gliding motility-associated-like protein
MPYQQVVINLSAYCPGTQLKWRAREQSPDGFGNYTPTYNFTVPGVPPTLTATATANPTSVCPGGCATLSASSTGACGTPTYSWSPGGAGASVSVCPAATTSYTLTVTDPGGLCPVVRTATASVTVSTTPAPVAGTAAVAPASVCSGQPVNLSLTGHSGNVQWQSATAAGGPWANIGGATGSAYTWPSLTATTFFRAQVSNACQTVTTNVVSATVNPAPVAAFTSTTVCQGSATVFTNTSTISSGSISTYAWNFGSGGATSNQASPSHTYTTAGTYSVSLTVTSAAGCSHQVTQQVTVNPRPMVSFAANPVCLGQSMVFTNSSSISTGSIGTWQWNFGDGSGTSGQQSPSYTYSQFGTLNVSLTAISALGCSNQVTQSVTVRPVPVVAFSASPVCVGQSTAFVNSTTIGSGSVTTWLWDFGDGTATSAQQAPSHTYSTAGTYIVTLTATSALGCAAQVTQQVTVRPRPVVQFSAAPVCAGLAMAFTNTSSIASGSISTWQWDFGGQGTSAQAAPSFTFSAPGTYNVSLTATSDLGCSNVTVVPVTVHPVPVSQFSISPVCLGTATVFTDQSSVAGPGQINSWTWAFGDGASATQQSTAHTYAAAGSYQVTLTVVTANGCQHVSTQQATVNPTPVSSFTVAPVCESSQAVFVNTSSVSSGNIVSYAWNTGAGTSAAATPPAQSYPQAGTYIASLTVTTNAGCVNTSQQQVVIHPDPVAGFQFTDECLGDPTVFTDQSTISSGSVSSWQWNLDDGTTSAQPSPTHTYVGFGTYAVSLTVTSDFGCTDQVTQPVQVYTLPVASFTFADGCADAPVLFTNTSSGAANYVWDFGDGSTVTQQQPAAHSYTHGTYTVQLTAQTSSGCSDIEQQQVTVHPVPQAAFAVTQQCEGTASVFTDNSTVPGVGQITAWDWDFGDGNVSTQPSPSHTYAADGSYSATLTVTTDNGCTDAVTLPVTVFPVPVSQFTMSAVCEGTASVFTDQSSVGQPGQITTWQWDFGDGNTSAQQSPTHTFATDGTFTVSLTVTTADGCTHTSSQQATVYPTPVSSFTFSDICHSEQATFTSTSTVSSGSIASYDWDLGEGTSTVADPSGQSYSQPGTYDVLLTVTTDQGCTHTSQQQITVHPEPVAAFQFAEVCLNELTVLTDQSSIASGSITVWQWDLGDGGSTSTQPSPNHTYATDGSYTVSLMVESGFGCTDQTVQTVQVYPLPMASFTLADVCAYDAVVFTNTSSGVGSFVWDFGDGTTENQQNATPHSYTHGTYTVQLTAQTGSGCSDMVQQQVTVHPVPQAAFAVTQECEGTASVFTDNSTLTGVGQIADWDWDFQDGNSSTQPSPAHTYAADGSYSATLTVTTDNGCTDAVTLPVTVFPVPVSQFTMSAVCEGTASVFTDQSSVGQPGQITTWQWDFGDGNTSAQQSPTHTFATDGTFTVSLTVTTADGCTHTSSQQATVYPTPVSSFTFSDVCVSSPADFVNTSTVSSGSIVANDWDLGVGASTDATPPAQTYPQAGTYNIILTVTTDNGCTHTSQQQLVIHPDPVTDFAFTEVCLGEATGFTDQSSISSGSIATWQWDLGDGITSAQPSPAHTYAADGTYAVTLTVASALGCTGQVTQQVQVYPLPVASFTFADVCEDDVVTFVNTSSGAASYAWDLGNGVTSALQQPDPQNYASGTYTVQLTAQTGSGCSDVMIQQVTVHPMPVAQFTALSVCEGVATDLIDNSSVSAGQVNAWQWAFGDGNVSAQQAPSHLYASDGSYSATLTVTTDQGCTDAITLPVTVHPVPVSQFALTAVCDGVASVFTDQSTMVQPGQFSAWQWDFGDGNASAQPSPTHTFATDGTYAVTLTVTTSDGCEHSSTQQATVYPIPVSSFTLTDVCASAPAVFVNTSTVSSGSITTYLWDTGIGTSTLAVPPAQAYPQAGAYPVSLTVTTANGCSHSSQQQITVHPVPVASFQFTEVCLGEENLFTDASSIAGGVIVSTDWDFGDGAGVSAQTSPSYGYAGQGSYVVTLSVTSDQGCTNQTSQTVEVFPLPTPAFSVANVCEIDPVVVTNMSTDAVSYSWDFGDGTSSTDAQPAPHSYTFGTYTVVLSAQSGNGCVAVLSKPVTVHPMPVADFTFSNVCQGIPTPIIDQSTVGGGGQIVQWGWDFGNGASGQGASPNFTYPQWGSYQVSLLVTTANGCTDQIMDGPIVVHPNPMVQFSNGLANCFGEVTDLVDFTTLDNAPEDVIASWQWTFSDGGISTVQNPSHTFTLEGIQTAALSVTTNNGCIGTATNNVEIYALPRVLFTTDTTRGCQPFRAQFIDQSTIPAPYFISDWQWDFGDGSEMVQGQFPLHTYHHPTMDPMGEAVFSVTLTVTSANGCVSTETYVDYMTEYPKPTAWFDVMPRRAELLFARMQVTDLSSPNVTGWEYDFDEGMNQFVQHPLHVYQDTGTFTITQYVTTQFGCLDTAITTVKVDPEFYFHIPNTFTPNSDLHNQTFFGTGVGVIEYQMIIFDRWGSQLFESNAMDNTWDGTKNGTPVQQGVYAYIFNIVDIKGDPHQYVGHVNLIR